MRRRTILALSTVALAGCTGASPDTSPAETTTTTEPPTTASSTTATTTMTAPCSTDISVSDPPSKPPNLGASAQSVVEPVESDVARAHFDPSGYFNFHLSKQDSRDITSGIEFQARVDVDFSSSGDGEDATTVQAHLLYDVTYRLTDRRVVRAMAEEGPTGTVVCW